MVHGLEFNSSTHDSLVGVGSVTSSSAKDGKAFDELAGVVSKNPRLSA